ncbi:hypothetical protein OIU74_029191, partial [Salix koriyanagi]
MQELTTTTPLQGVMETFLSSMRLMFGILTVFPSLESKKTIPSSRCSKKAPRKIDRKAKDGTPVTCASLPVNIPDWSKIYSDHQKKENTEGSVYPVDDDTDCDDDEDDHDDDQDGRVPPH